MRACGRTTFNWTIRQQTELQFRRDKPKIGPKCEEFYNLLDDGWRIDVIVFGVLYTQSSRWNWGPLWLKDWLEVPAKYLVDWKENKQSKKIKKKTLLKWTVCGRPQKKPVKYFLFWKNPTGHSWCRHQQHDAHCALQIFTRRGRAGACSGASMCQLQEMHVLKFHTDSSL